MEKLKNQVGQFHSNSKSPERVSIHGNSPSPIRGRHNQGAMGNYGNMVGSQGSNKYSASGSSGNSQSTQASMNSSQQNQNSHFLGANIDGIPLNNKNRSPPRSSGNTNNQRNDQNMSPSVPNLENQN